MNHYCQRMNLHDYGPLDSVLSSITYFVSEFCRLLLTLLAQMFKKSTATDHGVLCGVAIFFNPILCRFTLFFVCRTIRYWVRCLWAPIILIGYANYTAFPSLLQLANTNEQQTTNVLSVVTPTHSCGLTLPRVRCVNNSAAPTHPFTSYRLTLTLLPSSYVRPFLRA